jgi:hypothetical protein
MMTLVYKFSTLFSQPVVHMSIKAWTSSVLRLLIRFSGCVPVGLVELQKSR